MKKLILALSFILLVLPVNASPEIIMGQEQSYSVMFDGEGEATVVAKITIQNLEDNAIDKILLQIPGESVRMIYAVEEYFQECEHFCVEYYYPRLEYKKPDYTAQQLADSTLYTFTLSQKLEPLEQTTLILYYKANGYVDESLGLYKFDFKTIMTEYDVNEVRVAINVNSGLHLKEGKTDIDYRENFAALGKAMSAASEDIAEHSVYIGNRGEYTETAYGLDPWESFHVKGSYSEYKVLLYQLHATIALVALAVFLLFLNLFLAKRK